MGKNKKDESDLQITDTYSKYRKGISYLQQFNFFNDTDKCHRFFEGDQWRGVNVPSNSGVSLPVLNIIKPILLYKIGVVAQKGFAINYSATNYDDPNLQIKATKVCDLLNADAQRNWENLNLDTATWEIALDSGITGEKYAYFFPKISKHTEITQPAIISPVISIDDEGNEIIESYDEIPAIESEFERLDGIEMKQVDGTNILFGDENNPELQEQPYILLPYRDSVRNVIAEAEDNGIPKEELDLIIADTDYDYQAGDRAKDEVNTSGNNGKCNVIVHFKKIDNVVHFKKTTKFATVQDWTKTGMKLYPIAGFLWNGLKGSARGLGEVLYNIPNQIEINRTKARELMQIKTSGNILAYNKRAIPDPSPLMNGSNIIGLDDDDAREIASLIAYLKPPPMNSEVRESSATLMNQTRELAGAGDIALGAVNPEKASGAAILAVRDAAAVPLNGQGARFRKFIEDIARILIDIKNGYSPNGIDVVIEEEIQSGVDNFGNPIMETVEVIETIPAEIMEKIKLSIKVDVSPADPWSKYAEGQRLEGILKMLLERGKFDEIDFIESLPDDTILSKQNILERLRSKQQPAPPPLPPNMPPGQAPPGANPPQIPLEAIMAMAGQGAGAPPIM
ncbi:MAG: hypothetical protein FWE47_00055 [Oscillospiraceae bacterium]|nr:hypothetical protein [Oscillospiraceae bacterium]